MASAEIPHTSQPMPSPDAARYLNVSDSWLRQTRMAGRADGPPYRRLGTRMIRYLRVDLDRWLEQRVCSPGGRPQPGPAPAPAPTKPKRRRKPMARNGGRRRSAR